MDAQFLFYPVIGLFSERYSKWIILFSQHKILHDSLTNAGDKRVGEVVFSQRKFEMKTRKCSNASCGARWHAQKREQGPFLCVIYDLWSHRLKVSGTKTFGQCTCFFASCVALRNSTFPSYSRVVLSAYSR